MNNNENSHSRDKTKKLADESAQLDTDADEFEDEDEEGEEDEEEVDKKTSLVEIKTNQSFEKILNDALATKKYILIKFGADWCPPCKRIVPQLDKLAKNNQNVCVFEVDKDRSSGLFSENKISTIPTMILFRPVKDSSNNKDSKDTKVRAEEVRRWVGSEKINEVIKYVQNQNWEDGKQVGMDSIKSNTSTPKEINKTADEEKKKIPFDQKVANTKIMANDKNVANKNITSNTDNNIATVESKDSVRQKARFGTQDSTTSIASDVVPGSDLKSDPKKPVTITSNTSMNKGDLGKLNSQKQSKSSNSREKPIISSTSTTVKTEKPGSTVITTQSNQ